MKRSISNHEKLFAVLFAAAVVIVLLLIGVLREVLAGKDEGAGTYAPLAPDTSTDDPLAFLDEDFYVQDGFHTNLPIVLLSVDEELPEYKSFASGEETVMEGVDPYTTGSIRVLEGGTGEDNTPESPVVYESDIRIKKRGHTSYAYDKSQYLIKAVDKDGLDNEADILGMGAGSDWILNGSMADKSMLRNYLPYRIASEIDGNAMAPDSRYVEVLSVQPDGLRYEGVYLLMETISRGDQRVNIEKYDERNSYSSYIVRRDRETHFDLMLDTYGRENGFAEQYIGLKYPSAKRASDAVIDYIERDFSKTEEVLYSDDKEVFRVYDKYLDIDSFADYMLINEYFGNYDAGEHSTYMYKNSGDLLHIGPVWDFDQAMNNYFADEMETETLAFQTAPVFDRLCLDRRFIDVLKTRYSKLQNRELSEEHVFAVIDETVDYLRSAREREWYRWAADYLDDSFRNPGNYYLEPYLAGDVLISRFNDEYDQEIYNIKTYLHKHSTMIQRDLTELYDLAEMDSSVRDQRELLLLVIIVLFMLPSYVISRK